MKILLGLTLTCGLLVLSPIWAEEARESTKPEQSSTDLASEDAADLLRSEDPEKQLEGIRLLEKAAEAGDVEALTNLGVARLRGLGGSPVDEAGALAIWEKAAAKGSARARLNLGILLRQAQSLPTQPERSVEELRAAAETGLVDAHSVLGRLLFNGDRYQDKDYEAAIPHLRIAAEAGDAICQNTLGVALRDGWGVSQDLVEAREWFEKSAAQNHTRAQTNLARIMGVEVPGNPEREQALTWLIIAKDQADHTATRIFNELFISFTPGELARAQKAAEEYLLRQRKKGS
jgi:TPR repeat protein